MPIIDQYNEDRLIKSLKHKDEQAFNYLYDNYSAALYGIVIKVIGSVEEANDLLQEIFIKIWRNIDNYDSKKGRLYTWMLQIARNTAIDKLRSSGFQRENSNVSLAHNPLVTTESSSDNIHIDHLGLKDIVQKLDKNYQLIIELAYFKGYTQQEIAEMLKIPLGTVKTRSRKALIELKKIME